MGARRSPATIGAAESRKIEFAADFTGVPSLIEGDRGDGMRIGGKGRYGATAGFSLLEIMASVAVIVVIMTMLAMGVRGLLPLSKAKQAHTDIVHIQQALEGYRAKFGEYPRAGATGEGTASVEMEVILFNTLNGTLAPNGELGNFPVQLDRSALEFENASFPLVGGTPSLHVNRIVDPWGTPFVYRYDPRNASWQNYNYVLYSAGPDGLHTAPGSNGLKNEGALNNDDNIYAE